MRLVQRRDVAVAAVVALVAGCDSGIIGADNGNGDGGSNGSGIDARRGADARIRVDAAPLTADAPPGSGNPATGPGGGSNLTCGGSSFPPNATIYQDVYDAPRDVESTMILDALESIGWANAGARQDLGVDFSFEINCAGGSVARLAYTGGDDTQPDCDLAPVPVPAGGKTEGSDDYACSGGDCHLIVYQGDRLYELYQANIDGGQPGGAFTGTCLAIWDLTRDYWDPSNVSPDYSRGDGCDGGNAADIPIAPTLLTLEELNAALPDGMIHHALRFTMVNSRIRSTAYVHPATHYGFGGTTGGPDTLPTGARLRLRRDYDLASLSSDSARVVARTLQHYGMYLADGGNIYISATTDASAAIGGSAMGALRPNDFDMVGGGRRIGQDDYSCDRVVVTD